MASRFLIVGGGLAGSLLAHSLITAEQRVTLVNTPSKNSASRVAAGLITPVTGQRLVLSPDVDLCLQPAMDYYSHLATQFKKTFFHPNVTLRLFTDNRDRDRFHTRQLEPAYQAYLGEEFAAGQSGEMIYEVNGGFWLHKTGHLDIPVLLDCLRDYINSHGHYREETLDYRQIRPTADGVFWNAERYDHVIFCEGAAALENTWFRWLPFQLSKGDVIAVNSKTTLPRAVISKGIWVLPFSEHQARVGASYCWEWDSEAPDHDAGDELLAACKEILPSDASLGLTERYSAIRPTTRDRQPFIGSHPAMNRLCCFNGFGSRGALLIPYYAHRLVQYLLHGESLPAQADVGRLLKSRNLVSLARYFITEQVAPGDVVIDATTGNGNDTELLARCTGEQGHVFGFDIQQEAINNTTLRLKRAGLLDRVTLIKASHAEMKCHIIGENSKNLSMAIFNLGFLPGFSRECTTSAVTTINALESALELLREQGVLLIAAYSGHERGKNETENVRQWVLNLDKARYECQSFVSLDADNAPELFKISKMYQ